MNILSRQYDWSLISRYRNLLMGIGILGVMMAHFLEWGNVEGPIALLFKPFNGLVFTEGFLFLSGFGLYYSYSRKGDLKDFYKKRINRLLAPFIIISLPFYIERMLHYDKTIGELLLNVSSLRFWILGNDGMWYISVSILLYCLFPLVYHCIFGDGNNNQRAITLRSLIVLLLSILIVFSIKNFFPSYYNQTEIGLTQMPIFIVGIYFGYLSKGQKHFRYDVLFLLFLGIMIPIITLMNGVAADFENSIHRLLCISILCLLFLWAENHINKVYKCLKAFFEWFGKYTLEMYILHMFVFYIIGRYMNSLVGGAISVAIAIVIAPCVHDLVDRIQQGALRLIKNNQHAI